MKMKMRTMMKNETMFSADSTKNTTSVHSLQKNVSNNRSMKNTFLTTMSNNMNVLSINTNERIAKTNDNSNAQTQSISKPMKKLNLFVKSFGVLALIIASCLSALGQSTTPTITSISPLFGPVGTTVTITGTNFNPTAANNSVFYGGVKASITAASATQLTITIPSGDSRARIQVVDQVNYLSCISKSYFSLHNGTSTITSNMLSLVTPTSAMNSNANRSEAQNVSVTDINSDGIKELSSSSGPNLNIVENASSSIAPTKTTIALNQGIDYSTNTIFCDFNNDGKVDLCTYHGQGYEDGWMFLNTSTGSPSFGNGTDLMANSGWGFNGYDSGIGDLNKDGKIDIIGAYWVSNISTFTLNTSSNGSWSSTFQGDGQAQYSSSGYVNLVSGVPNGTQVSNFVTADFNGDGYEDYVVSGGGNTWIVLNTTTTSGSNNIGISSTSLSLNTNIASTGDFDNDGDIDILMALSGGSIYLYTNNGAGVFTGTNLSITTNGFKVADFDGDGDEDIINFINGGYTLIRNTSTSSISFDNTNATVLVTSSSATGEFLVLDFNNDGIFEIVSINSGNYRFFSLPSTTVASTSSSLSGFVSCVGTSSTFQTTSVSGSVLSNDITVTAPSNYEISLTSGSGYASSLTLTQTGGVVNATTVYVRMTASATGTPSGNITISSTGAANVLVALTGIVGTIPSVPNAGNNLQVCTGTSVTLAATVTALTTYTWNNGITDNVAFTAINATTSPITTTYTLTATSQYGCTNTDQVDVTVQPVPTVNQQSNITYCGGVAQPSITFTGTTSNTQYAFTSSQHVGFFFSGIANPTIGGYHINPSNQVVSTVAVTPQIVVGGLTCSGSNMTFTVTVNPIPSVNSNVNQTVCNGSTTTAVNFTGSHVGNTYAWSNNNTTTGFAASGTGNIPAVTATNISSSIQTSTITVTPTLNGCSGTTRTFSLTVNPTPTVDQPANQIVCAGTNSAAINFTGAVSGTNYTWSSSNTAVGLATSGSGNIASFPANNSTNAPITTTITVTPSFGSIGTTFGETSENGTITLTAPTGSVFTGVTYASYGNPTGSNGNYTNGSCHSNTSQAVVEALALGQTSVTINATDVAFGTPCVGTQSLAVVLAYGPICTGTPKTFTLSIVLPPTVAAITGATNVCNGQSTQLASATSGGTWSSSNASIASVNASGVVTGLSAGNVIISYSVTNSNGCTTSVSASVNVINGTSATITAAGATTFCQGANVTLNANAGSGFSYQWNNNTNDQSLVVSTSGTYTVTVTDANGCSATSAVTTVTVNPLPSATAISGITALCVGATTVLSTTSANPTWSSSNAAVANVSATGVVTGVASGTATITYSITNTNGCSNTASTTVTVSPLPTATITAAGATTFCQGANVTLNANAGSGFSYQWNNNTNDQSLIVSAAGAYTVTVTSANGCSATSAVTTVNVNPLPSTTAILGTTALCVGTTTGLSTTSSNPTWSSSNAAVANVSATGVVTGVASGTASITYSITNANGCSNTASTTVTVSPLPTATIAAIGSTTFCQGANVTLLAANAPSGSTYVYQWGLNGAAITGAASNTYVASTPGNYSVTITANNLCQATSANTTVTVNPLPVLLANTGASSICKGSTTTLANSTPGGTWSSSDNTIATINAGNGLITGVNPGIVQLTYSYTNGNGCTSATSTSFTVNSLPSAVITTNGPTTFCQGGSVTLTASTGTTYLWSTGATTASIVINTSGNYDVTVTNANGCSSVSAPIAVTVNPLPVAAITANGPTTFCAGGSVTLVATTGSSYLWNNGQITQSITADVAGTYSATITTAAGCSAITNSITVTVNALPTAVVTANGPTTFCQGNNVLLTASGGTSYLWSTGATTQSIVVSTIENIQVDVTNANGCTSAAANTIVTVLPVTVATITANGPTAICLGSNVTLSATAGTGLTYLWSNGVTTATTQNITVNTSGVYAVTVTNTSGCSSTASQTVTVNVNPAITVTANGPTLFCQGGNVTLTAAGAATYLWNTGDFTSSITVSAAGSYFVVGTNANGCETTSALTVVTVGSIPTVASITGANNVCESGTINLSSSTINGTWTSANNFIATVSSTGVVTGLNAGTTNISYTVTNGTCANTVTAVVNVLNNPVIPIITPSGATTMCPGGTVILFASNGANYQWTSGQTTPFISVNQSGNYAVTVTNASGCSATSMPMNVFIGDNTNPVIVPAANITIAPNLGCEAIGVNLGTPVATDNCSVASASNNAPAIYPLGLTTVTWTVVDGSGNTATATQLVNVVDNILPTINVGNITVVVNDNGSTTISFSDVDNGTTDNCGIASMTLSQYTYGCADIGENNITVTVTDNNGNVATSTILVTVVTSGTDTDNDGILNACDSDDDADGIDDTNEVVGDSDSDGILNSLDADDDGDGIPTITEGTDDQDGDGTPNYLDSDSDGDGISDDFEWDFGGLGEPGQDCDNDGVYDFLDTDLCGPVIPEAFTPNGNGFNDNFVIPGIEGYKTRSVSIYSRYGTLVYESSEYNNDWNGTLLNSSTQVPDGTYYYIFTLDNNVIVNGYVYINRVQK